MASRAVCGRRVEMAADLDAAHQPALRDQVGAHLAGADHADAHRAAFVGASGEIAGKPGEDDVGHEESVEAFASAE